MHSPKPSLSGGETPSAAFLEPVVVGTLCALLSAVAYTAANVCLRAVSSCDPVWVSCIKSLPTIALVAPWLLIVAKRGEPVLPRPKVLLMLAAAGAFGQIAGNVSFQWALGVIGMALTVPLTLGAIILSGAILGRLLLHEPVTPRTAVSIVLLIAAICVLSLGARDAYDSVVPAASRTASQHLLWMTAGVGAAVLSGVAYATLGVAIRYGVTGGASQPATLMIVAVTGLVSLGSISTVRIGPQEMFATAPRDLAVMLAAGVCNALAFVALTKALQLVSVVYVNSLNATQATMGALCGVIFFREAVSSALLAGVVLTIVGLVMMKSRRPRPGEDDEAATALQATSPLAADGEFENPAALPSPARGSGD